MRLFTSVLSITVALTTALCSAPALSETETPDTRTEKRPRIGLVLSGGGARGAAHIGVLRRLHEMQVPVDFVVGTSMGALVGGLYASGMTPQEIDTMTRGLDFTDMFRDGPAPAEMPIRRKLQDYNYLLDVEVGLRDGQLFFPTGVLRGQKMALLLRRLTLPVRNIQDFDALPTPFRAIATDLGTAEAVVFNSGDLVTAMRASMAVPGVFFPVNYRGRKLVDGGIVQNLPIPIAQQFGADILIVVDVGMPLDPVDTLDSPFAVSSQVIDGMMLNESRRHLERLGPADIVIRPRLGDFDSTDFDAIPAIIERGADAAREIRSSLKEISLDDASWQDFLQSRQKPQDDVPEIIEVKVADDASRFARQLQAHTHVEPGQPLDLQQLEDDLVEMHGLRRFGMLDYTVEPLPDKEAGSRLVLDAEPREIGRQVAELGFQLADDFQGDTRFALLTGLTFLDLNELGAEWRNDLYLGEITGIKSEFYQPVDYGGNFFIAAQGKLHSQIYRAEDETGLASTYRIDEESFGLDAGIAFGNYAEWRLGLRAGNEEINDVRGDPLFINGTKARIGDVVTRFRFDTMDSFAFPSRGVRFGLAWVKSREWLGSEQAFEYAGFEWLSAHPFIGDRNRILFGLELQTVLETERNLSERVTLGGLTRLSGLPTDSLVGQHSALARVVYSRYLGQDPDRLFDLPLYTGITLEAGNVWQDRDAVSRNDLVRAGSLFLALDTELGPVGIAYGHTSNGDSSFYLTIGSVTGPRLQPFLR